MALVNVKVKNNTGAEVTLRLDDTDDAERIDYLQKLARREDLASVTVTKVPAPKSTPKTAD